MFADERITYLVVVVFPVTVLGIAYFIYCYFDKIEFEKSFEFAQEDQPQSTINIPISPYSCESRNISHSYDNVGNCRNCGEKQN